MRKGLEALRFVYCSGLGQNPAQGQETWIAEMGYFSSRHELLASTSLLPLFKGIYLFMAMSCYVVQAELKLLISSDLINSALSS